MTARTLSALVAAILTTLVAPRGVLAQSDGDAVTIGTWRELESEVLGETRRVIVATPRGYERDTERTYPVVYLLDGEWHVHHTTGLTGFLAGPAVDVSPPVIVVAVTNTDRARDMTPPTAEPGPIAPTGGGADNFVRFFAEELIPFIEGEYRTAPYRVLIGHSFGGLFAVHTLVHAPETFDAYLAISPSLWWDEQRLVEQAESFFEATDELDRTLYMTMGSEGGSMVGGMRKLEGVLAEHAPRGFEWDSRVMEEETHNSTVYRSTRQGLEFIFRHWGLKSALTLYEHGGVEAVETHFAGAQERYGVERSMQAMTLMGLGGELAMAGRLDEARTVIEHDPARYPPSGFVYFMLAEQHENRDDSQGAIECYTRALQLDPASRPARDGLAKHGVDPDSIETDELKLPVEALVRFEGDYVDGDSGDTYTFTLVGGRLVSRGPGLNDIPLTALAEDRFLLSGTPAEVVFETGDDGAVTGISVLVGGREVAAAARQR